MDCNEIPLRRGIKGDGKVKNLRMKKFDHLGYNKNLREMARKLRKNSTPAEIKLWKEVLRGKKMHGYQFLRQRPVMNFIADFMYNPEFDLK